MTSHSKGFCDNIPLKIVKWERAEGEVKHICILGLSLAFGAVILCFKLDTVM